MVFRECSSSSTDACPSAGDLDGLCPERAAADWVEVSAGDIRDEVPAAWVGLEGSEGDG